MEECNYAHQKYLRSEASHLRHWGVTWHLNALKHSQKCQENAFPVNLLRFSRSFQEIPASESNYWVKCTEL